MNRFEGTYSATEEEIINFLYGKGPQNKCVHCSKLFYIRGNLLNHNTYCTKDWKKDKEYHKELLRKIKRDAIILMDLYGVDNLEYYQDDEYIYSDIKITCNKEITSYRCPECRGVLKYNGRFVNCDKCNYFKSFKNYLKERPRCKK